MNNMSLKPEELLNFIKESGLLVILTGAGMSAESGIPTFRGEEGYWKVGSKHYHPQEMATLSMFSRVPYEVWKWYLYRRETCNQVQPNSGHIVLGEMEKKLKDRFLLITQNVDGLHIRAGNSRKRTYEIHGNINRMRCSEECSRETFPIPVNLQWKDKEREFSREEKNLLVCPLCGKMARPHILWFDECYNELYYKFESSLSAADKLDLLIVIGTTGTTTLPYRIITGVMNRGKPFIVIDPYENDVTELAKQYNKGCHLQHKSGEILPEIYKIMNER